MVVLLLALACSGAGKDEVQDSDDTATPDSDDTGAPDSQSDDSGADDSGADDSGADDSADTGPVDFDGDGYPAAEDCDDYDPDRWDQVGGTLIGWVSTSNVNTVCDGVCERAVNGAIELENINRGAFSALDCITEVGLWVEMDCDWDTVGAVGFERLERVEYELYINCQGAEALSGFEALSYVGGLRLAGSNFTDLSALSGLREIDGDLSLYGMEGLPDLSAFAGLERLSGDLHLVNLPLLSSLEGLEGSIEGVDAVTLEGLDQLSDLGVLADAGALRRLTLEELPALTDLSPVPDGTLDWLRLHDLPLEDLSSLDGVSPVEVQLNTLQALNTLEGLELDALRDLSLSGCDGLEELGDLSALSELDGLHIYGNDNLETLDGLSGLRQVSGRLQISQNAQLRDLSGLHGLVTPGTELYIHDNPCLPQSEVDALLEAIGEDALPEDRMLERNEGPC